MIKTYQSIFRVLDLNEYIVKASPLEVVLHGPPAKNTPVHKPCSRESKAAKPISGHRQLQWL